MLTKLWLHNLLLRGILSVGMVMGTVIRTQASFNAGVYCTVYGDIYHDGFKVFSYNRSDYCAVINDSINGNVVILWGTKHWVRIVVPKNIPGIYLLRYKWGSDDAYIGDQPIQVEWGLVMRG